MKIYSILVTILFVIFLGYAVIAKYFETENLSKEIYILKGKDKNTTYSLSYSKNGDLIFSLVPVNPSVPPITHWDYYGSLDVVSYEWLDDKTVAIEMRDSILKITLPEFYIEAKF